MKRSEAAKALRLMAEFDPRSWISDMKDCDALEYLFSTIQGNQKLAGIIASALESGEWEPEAGEKGPTVERVTPEGRAIYNTESVVDSKAARKHLASLSRDRTEPPLPATAREKVEEAKRLADDLARCECEFCQTSSLGVIRRLLTEALADAPSGAVPPPDRVSNSTATDEAPEGR